MTPTRVLLSMIVPLSLLISSGARTGFAQSSGDVNALRKEMQTLREEHKEIRSALEEIKKLLQPRRAATFKPIDLSIEKSPYLGDENAKVTLVEFTDYACPFCGRHIKDAYGKIVSDYVKTGKVKYVAREYPLPIHPKAFKAAEAALCAGDQGKYWQMRDQLFANQKKLAEEDLAGHAKAAGLELTAFGKCLEAGKYAERVRRDLAEGKEAGVTGTPTFLFGRTDLSDPTKIRAVKRLRGAHTYERFRETIEELLAPPQVLAGKLGSE